MPGNNARNVPDLSFSASPNHDGYLVYSGGILQIYGGTSVAAPSFAGIATLLNQYLVSNGAEAAAGLGNMNPELYSLAQTAPNAFHDITTGNNIVTVPCPSRVPKLFQRPGRIQRDHRLRQRIRAGVGGRL